MAHSNMFYQAVGPKAGTPGTSAPDAPSSASAGTAQAPQQSTWFLLAPMLVVVVFMLFTNRTQRKREADTRAKLKKGDRVVSTSGLIGELVDMADGLAKVKIAPGTNVQMLLASVSPYEPGAAGAAAAASASPKSAPDQSLKDLKEAKATSEKKG